MIEGTRASDDVTARGYQEADRPQTRASPKTDPDDASFFSRCPLGQSHLRRCLRAGRLWDASGASGVCLVPPVTSRSWVRTAPQPRAAQKETFFSFAPGRSGAGASRANPPIRLLVWARRTKKHAGGLLMGVSGRMNRPPGAAPPQRALSSHHGLFSTGDTCNRLLIFLSFLFSGPWLAMPVRRRPAAGLSGRVIKLDPFSLINLSPQVP